MVDLVVFADHIVFQLALGGQDADFPQQRRGAADLDEILPSAVQQGIRRCFLVGFGSFLLALLHFYALCICGKGHGHAALGVGQYAFLVLLSLCCEKFQRFRKANAAGCALEGQRVRFAAARQGRFEFFLAGTEQEIDRNEVFMVLLRTRFHAGKHELQFVFVTLLHVCTSIKSSIYSTNESYRF